MDDINGSIDTDEWTDFLRRRGLVEVNPLHLTKYQNPTSPE